jgi:hypothetical protein
MEKTISNAIIRKFHPCYDPSDVIKNENEELPIKDWVHKYRDIVPANDIIWLLLRKEFMSEKDLRLFAVWCAREALKIVANPDHRSVEACNVAERYANGEATQEEIHTANDAAYDAAHDVADAARYAAAHATAAAYAAANAARAAAHASYAAHDITDATYATYDAALAAYDAASDAAIAVAYVANVTAYDARKIARNAQVNKLLTYFE